MKSKLSVILGLVLCTAAFAGDNGYPLSGQDGTFLSNSGSVSLVDKKQNTFLLQNGMNLRIRLSNQSKSFHLMKGDGKDSEFLVPGGFPNGDLRNFSLSGAEFGNPGVSIVGRTYEQTISSSEHQETRSCSYACGQDYVCRQVPNGQTCHNETVCRPSQVCRTENGVEHCTTVDRCEVESRCYTDYRQECGYETRYCRGSETVEVANRNMARIFDLQFTDENQKTDLGKFQSTLKAWSDSVDLRTINYCN